ncbi:MAG: hypothetical protein DMF61_10320 [Blastocatellia bacterium AA13]|nr:MAG: hypothetical protein DMF61_10320 [Blastocatellia bacterium AA13]
MKEDPTKNQTESGGSRALFVHTEEAASSSRRRTWLVFGAIVLLLLIVALLLVIRKKKPGTEETEAVVVSVRVAKVERGSISSEVSALGTVIPRETAVVSSKINAQIKQMPLLRNKQVKAGDEIVAFESRDLQAQRAEAAAALEEAQANERLVTGSSIPEAAAQDEKLLRDAQANLANTRSIYDRRKALFDQGGISRKDLDASQLAVTTAENDLRAVETAVRLHQTAAHPNNRLLAEARVKQARDRLSALDTQLSYATVRAPFSGIITEQFQYQGEFAAAGGKLFTIANVSEVIVKAPFADSVASQLKLGDPVAIYPQDLPGEHLSGQVSLISRSTDTQSRTVEIWVNLQNETGKLRADASARVVVSAGTINDALIVPAPAVVLEATNADEGKVMAVDEQSIAHETKVTVGLRSGNRTQIVSGLKEGDTVVIEGNYALPDGAKVEISQGEEEEHGGKNGKGDSKDQPDAADEGKNGNQKGNKEEEQ